MERLILVTSVLLVALLILLGCRGTSTQIERGSNQSTLSRLALPAAPTMLPPLTELGSGLPSRAAAVKEITAVALAGGGFATFARVAQPTAADMRWQSDLVAPARDQERLLRWNGNAWVPVDEPLLVNGSPRFTVDPQRGWLYANGYMAQGDTDTFFLLRSRDGGSTWEAVRGWETEVQALARAIVPTGDGALVADTGDGHIVLTRDDGATWTPVSLPVVDDSTVLAQWTLIGAGPATSDTLSVAIFKPIPGSVEAVLYATADGGQTWQEVGTPGVGNALPFADPADASKLLDTKAPPFSWHNIAATGSTYWATGYNPQETNKPARAVWRSSDAGKGWVQAALPMRTILTGIAAVDDQTALVGTMDRGVLMTQDGGTTWQVLAQGLPMIGPPITALAATIDDGHTLLHVAIDQTVYQSLDQGRSWSSLGTPWSGDEHHIVGLLADPAHHFVYAMRNAGSPAMEKLPALSVWRDGVWHTLESAPNNHKTTTSTARPRLVADPWQAGGVYALLRKSVYHSLDQGASWQALNFGVKVDPDDNYANGVMSIAFDAPRHTIYAGAVLGSDREVLLTSHDQGSTWGGQELDHRLLAASKDMPDRVYLTVWSGNLRVRLPDGSVQVLEEESRFVGKHAIAVVPTVPETVLVDANSDSQIAIINVDQGTWHSMPLPWRKPGDKFIDIHSIVPDPVNVGRFYVATDIGLYGGTLP